MENLPIEIKSVTIGALIAFIAVAMQSILQWFLTGKQLNFQSKENSTQRNLELKKELLIEATIGVNLAIEFLYNFINTDLQNKDINKNYMTPIFKWQKIYLVANSDTLKSLDTISKIYVNVYLNIFKNRLPADKLLIDTKIEEKKYDRISKIMDNNLEMLKSLRFETGENNSHTLEEIEIEFEKNDTLLNECSEIINRNHAKIFKYHKDNLNEVTKHIIPLLEEFKRFLVCARKEIDVDIDHAYWDSLDSNFAFNVQDKMNELLDNTSDVFEINDKDKPS